MSHTAPVQTDFSKAHAGWRSRGYLPHFDSAEVVQHIIFRAADALPSRLTATLDREASAQRLTRIDNELDRGYGTCLLAKPEIAELVEGALLHFDGKRYRLLAWCIMPTHVHVLAAQMFGHPLSQIVQAWKSFSAHAANKILAQKKPFWAPEYYDRYMREGTQFKTTRAYIENNPVAAALCATRGDWGYSSAWQGRGL